ncbi:hypothetical protein ACQJBY_036452 [Aegilops geniculata]
MYDGATQEKENFSVLAQAYKEKVCLIGLCMQRRKRCKLCHCTSMRADADRFLHVKLISMKYLMLKTPISVFFSGQYAYFLFNGMDEFPLTALLHLSYIW